MRNRNFILPGMFFILTFNFGVVNGQTTVPFDPSGGLVVVEAVINDSVRGRFGIDTGADFFYIDRQFARDNGIKFTQNLATRGVVGMQGGDSPSLLSISSLQVGEERLENLRAMAIDLANLANDPRAISFDGLIGTEVLKQFYVTVDYPNSSITLETSRPNFLRGNNYNRIPFHTYKDHIIIETIIEDHRGILMLFDYCASITTISPQTAERLGLPTDDDVVYPIDIQIDSHFRTDSTATVTRDITPIRKAMPRAQFEGILGASFLRDHKVTIDYDLQVIYIHK